MAEEEKDETSTPEASSLTEEQVIKIVNAAVSNHVGRRTKQIEDKLSGIVSKFEELSAAPPAKEGPEATTEEDDRLKAMQARLKEMENAVATRERQLQEQEEQRKTQSARGALKDALAEAGVPADRLKQAVGYLFDAEKRVEYSESGDLEFLIPEAGYTDRLDIGTGVQKFLGSAEGQMYLPARDVGGSGNQGGRPPRAKPSAPTDSLEDMSHEELLSELGKAMIGH